MVGKIRNIQAIVIQNYYTLALCGITLWLSYVLFTVNHYLLSLLIAGVVIIKLTGMLRKSARLRTIGLVGMNAIWAINTTIFVLNKHHPVNLTYVFPLFVLVIGFGVALRSRFNEW